MKSTKIILVAMVLTIVLTLPLAILNAQNGPEVIFTAEAIPDECNTFCTGPNSNPLKCEQCKNLYKVGEKSYGIQGLANTNPTLLADRVGRIINLVLSVFGVVFFGLIVFSGFQWMTAGGSEEKVTKAKDRIMRAAIGLGIIIMAWAMTAYVVTKIQEVPDSNNTPADSNRGQTCVSVGGNCTTAGACTADFGENIGKLNCGVNNICCFRLR